MKRSGLIFSIALLASTPAMALKITNLDNVVHRVELAGHGKPEVFVIQPGDTLNTTGRPGGMLALLSAPVEKKGKGVVQSDGLLSDYIGGGRNSGIPAEDHHAYVIWPGAKLMVQSRQRRYSN